MRSVRRGGRPGLRGSNINDEYKTEMDISLYKNFETMAPSGMTYTELSDYTKTSENYIEFETQFKKFVDALTENRYLVKNCTTVGFDTTSASGVYAIMLHLKIETDSELEDDDPKKYQYVTITFNGMYGYVTVIPSMTEMFKTKTYLIEDDLQSSLFRLVDIPDLEHYNADKYEDLYKKVPVVLDANENLDFYKNVYLTLTEIPFLECMGWDYRGRCRVAGYNFQKVTTGN